MKYILRVFIIVIMAISITHCTSVDVFSKSARPGETVTFTLGWNQSLTAADITMSITDSSQTTIQIQPRAVVNLYPDPISNLIVETETNPESGANTQLGAFWGFSLEDLVTSKDKEYSQKLIVVNVPLGLNSGQATINISTASFSTSVNLEILPPVPADGIADNFAIQETLFPGLGISFGDKLRLAERAQHNVIHFSGTEIPYAIQLDMVHAPDKDSGGVGRPFISSGRSDVKNISWYDDGSNMRLIIMPSNSNQIIPSFSNFKFYVAGGITDLQVSEIFAYNANGEIINGVIAHID